MHCRWAGDKGLSGSGTAVTKHICPYNFDADSIKHFGYADTLPTDGFYD